MSNLLHLKKRLKDETMMDPEELGQLIETVMNAAADALLELEPYATNTADAMRRAGRQVEDTFTDIEEAL